LAIRLFKDLEEIKAAVTGSLSITFRYLADRLTEATAKRTGLYMYVPAIGSVGLYATDCRTVCF